MARRKDQTVMADYPFGPHLRRYVDSGTYLRPHIEPDHTYRERCLPPRDDDFNIYASRDMSFEAVKAEALRNLSRVRDQIHKTMATISALTEADLIEQYDYR